MDQIIAIMVHNNTDPHYQSILPFHQNLYYGQYGFSFRWSWSCIFLSLLRLYVLQVNGYVFVEGGQKLPKPSFFSPPFALLIWLVLDGLDKVNFSLIINKV